MLSYRSRSRLRAYASSALRIRIDGMTLHWVYLLPFCDKSTVILSKLCNVTQRLRLGCVLSPFLLNVFFVDGTHRSRSFSQIRSHRKEFGFGKEVAGAIGTRAKGCMRYKVYGMSMTQECLQRRLKD